MLKFRLESKLLTWQFSPCVGAQPEEAFEGLLLLNHQSLHLRA